MTTNTGGSPEGTEIVKWYTRARRFPQLIGKTPDGTTIWGGPYTHTQVIAGVGWIVVGSKTTWLWGHFGLIGNALILLGSGYGIVIALGRLPIGSRNPLSVGAGLIHALSCPAQGNLGGAPVRIRRPHRARSRVVITPLATTGAHIAEPAPAPAPARVPAPAPAPARPQRPGRTQPAPTAPSRQRPTPAASPNAQPPALTNVQRLLASAGAPRQED